MTPPTREDPACVGALLRSDAYTEVICDSLHVAPPILHALFATKGPGRVIAVSDSMLRTYARGTLAMRE